jgi:hypothetical protein
MKASAGVRQHGAIIANAVERHSHLHGVDRPARRIGIADEKEGLQAVARVFAARAVVVGVSEQRLTHDTRRRELAGAELAEGRQRVVTRVLGGEHDVALAGEALGQAIVREALLQRAV